MFGRLFALSRRLIHLFCLYVKHTVLAWAHPLPKKIEVYPGEEGSIEHAIVAKVMQSVPEAAVAAADDCARPFISLDGEWVATGWQTVVRYLGSIDKSMPTTPTNALKVNMFLEIVADIVARPPVDQDEFERALIPFETAIERDGVRPDHLGGLGVASLADVVAWEALEHVVSALADEVDWSKVPRTKEWFQLTSLDAVLDGGNGDEEEETPEDDTACREDKQDK